MVGRRGCRVDGISRATAHKWLRRFRKEGPAGLVDRSSAPYRSPNALSGREVRRIDPDRACDDRPGQELHPVTRVFDSLSDIEASHLLTRPYRPQTNGKGRAVQPYDARRVGLPPPLQVEPRPGLRPAPMG
jgi:hypothetical protein